MRCAYKTHFFIVLYLVEVFSFICPCWENFAPLKTEDLSFFLQIAGMKELARRDK